MTEKFPVIALRDLPRGSKIVVEVEGRSIGVYHAEDGALFAVLNVCPHRLAPICLSELRGTMMPSQPGEYIYGMDNRVLKCPWHAWEFDVSTGHALFGTDRRKLATFPVTVDDGQVVVAVRRRSTSPKATEQGPTG